MKNILTMLLAGGRGRRLNILATKEAKPALSFGGIYKIIDFTLSNISYSGLLRVGVLTQYRPTSLIEHIGNGDTWGLNIFGEGIKILPPFEAKDEMDWYKGTADAVFQNLNYITRYETDAVLIVSGDHIYQMDYSSMIKFHQEKGADVTISAMVVPHKEVGRFGVMETEDGWRIKKFIEKDPNAKSNLANMGVYCFKTDVLIKVLREIVPLGGVDFGKNIFPSITERYKVVGFPFKGYWRDVGTLTSYWEANMDILEEERGLDLLKWKIRTNHELDKISLLPPPKVGFYANVKRSILSVGCEIEGNVERSIISPNVKIERGACVLDSVIMHNCIVKRKAIVKKAILDKGVIVGRYSIIGKERGARRNILYPEHLEGGISVIGKNVVIGENSIIGENVIINPEIFIKEGSKIQSGETIRE